MKTIIFSFVLFFFSFCYSQEVIITYDFETKSFNKPIDKKSKKQRTLESGDKVTLKIININPFVYTVSHEKSLSVNNPLPKNIFSILLGDFTAFKSASSQEIKISNFTSDLINTDSIPNPCIDSIEVSDLIKKLTTFSTMHKHYSNLLFTVKKANLKKDELSNSLTAIHTLDIKFPTTPMLRDSYLKLKEQYLKVSSHLKTSGCVKDNALELISPVIKGVLNNGIEKDIMNLEVLKRSARQLVSQNSPLQIELSKFKIKGDELKIELDMQPRAEIKSFEIPIQEYKDSETFNIKNHFKVLFNPGVIFTDGINDNRYNVLRDEVNDTLVNYLIIKEKEPTINYGVSILSHFIWNFKKSSLGFNLGFGYLPKDSKLTGLIGGTAILGKKRKITIHAGLVVGFSKVLSDSLDENQQYSTLPEIKTKEELKTGVWFGFGYRL